MKAREIRKLERARAHREVKQYSQRINRAFSRLSEECSERVIRATSLEFPRDYHEECEVVRKPNRIFYSKPRTEMGITCAGRQKVKGKSIPLI